MAPKRRRIIPPDWTREKPFVRTTKYNTADGIAAPARFKVGQRRFVDKKTPEPTVRRYTEAVLPPAVSDAAGFCQGDIVEATVIKAGYVLIRRVWPPLEGEIREGPKREKPA